MNCLNLDYCRSQQFCFDNFQLKWGGIEGSAFSPFQFGFKLVNLH